MFKNEYQGGAYLDVFSAQGRDPNSKCKLTGSVKKEFDKLVRGYVYALEGGSSTTTTRIQLPKTEKSSLCLLQPCCVFQLLLPPAAKLVIDLNILDDSGGRRRLHLSSSQREVSATPLNARIPLGEILYGQWINLCVDIRSLVRVLFKGSNFKSLEGISVGGTCQLRRIFTLQVTPDIKEGTSSTDIPRAFQMSAVHPTTQIVSPENWTKSKSISGVGVANEVPSHSSSSESRPTHVAFGKKVAIPDHILTSRQSSRQTDSGGKAVLPHPPANPPADLSVLRVQKTRVRMLSGNSRKKGSKVANTDNKHKESNAAILGQRVEDTPRGSVEAVGVDSSVPILSSDEQLALKVLHTSTKEPVQIAGSTNLTSDSFDEQVYSYRSAPKSAERRVPPLVVSDEKGSRGAHLEEDFISSHEMLLPGTVNLTETRLSDDYDWRQYTSSDNQELQSPEDESLRTRLAAHKPDHHHHQHTPPESTSSGLEDTLSESMTLSEWNDQFHKAAETQFLDSLDTRGMGGMLSPAIEPAHRIHTEETDAEIKADELELMYDSQLNCFYDPITCKYYELIQDNI